MAQILSGKEVRESRLQALKKAVLAFDRPLTLAIVQVGDRADSTVYIESKKKCGMEIGIAVELIKLKEEITTTEVLEHIHKLNHDTKISGIIVQLPLPLTLDKDAIVGAIDPRKDADGLTPGNLQKLLEDREDAIVPATTKGIASLLEYYGISLEGKKVTVVGRSTLVGKPTALLCINKNATVTICHSKTENLEKETASADILIVAIGKPEFIGKKHVRSGQVVIDVGINSLSSLSPEARMKKRESTLVGDVNFDEVKDVVAGITPVPGGAGVMTVVSLFENVVQLQKII